MTNVPPSAASLRGAVDLSSLVQRANAPTPAPGQAAGAPGQPGAPVQIPSLVLEAGDANFGEVLELSQHVPVLVDLYADWAEQSTALSDVLRRVVAGLRGRLVLVRVAVEANPQLAQAFQAQSVPTVAAVIAGQPVPLFAGSIPEAQLLDIVEQLLELAAQNGVTGSAVAADAGAEGVDGAAAEPAEPVEEPLPPLHAEAYEAIERADYPAAIAAYKTAIAQDPRDELAVAGLAQVSLLHRLTGKTVQQIRTAAGAAPDDLDAQLDVADLDLSGGHVADAFDRLLTLFPKLDADGKNRVRERMLELFEVVGTTDPLVIAARQRLAMLLY
ncbi:tetratricopeptide repeat protein [Microterricola viridarii]|uniref:Putative thioredoxin n=1 Tax=Microterricola viridarii TaxID=412690 RepID=A0A1H1TA10_9MICO|nr:tetratricopeptide repeat protein [Microterricola viridarii]SDS56983.1 putative thioredoxin [Microterricola viridarii]